MGHGWVPGRYHTYASVMRCDLTEGYLGRGEVVLARLVSGRAVCRSIVPQMCFDESAQN